MKRRQGIVLAGVALLLGTQVLYAQTCNSNIMATAPDNRYTDNNDGTVTDNQTGLMWKQCSEGLTTTLTSCDTGSAYTSNWHDALMLAQTANSGGFAGYNDWRLPNRNELASLVERQCYLPAINQNRFPAVAVSNSGYWSSSMLASSSANAWVVFLSSGSVNDSNKNNGFSVLLVRGGQ